MEHQPTENYTYNSVVNAIGALYNAGDYGQLTSESASQWLDGFQKSIYSWQICNDILQHSTDLNCCYFAAQTMRSKIKHQFHELPPNTHHDLKASLFGHLNNRSRAAPQVVTQLCLAIADLALQMVQWRNSLQEIIVTLSRDSQLMENLLEILFVMPEEINNKSLRLGQNRRQELTGEWDQQRIELLDFFATCLSQYESAGNWKLVGKVLGAFGQWWSVGLFADADFVEQRRKDLLLAPFRFIANRSGQSESDAEATHTAAAECLCSAFYATEAVDLFPTVVPALVEAAMHLEPVYQASVAAQDASRCISICRVWSDMAQSLIPKLTQEPDIGLGSLRSVDLLLTVVGHPSRELAEYTLSFWYSFALAVSTSKSKELFKPYMERVVVALVKHCQWASPDSSSEDPDRDTSGFHEFRDRVTELLEDVLYLVEPERLLCTMFHLLKEFEGCASADWRLTESVLFLLCIIISEVSTQENQVTPQLLQAVLSLPPDSTPTPLQLTGLSFLGKMAVWVNCHQEFLGAVFPVLLNALSNPALASTSASALGQYCTFCKAQMQSQFVGLLQVAETLPNTAGLKPDAAQELLRGITQVLSRLSSDQEMTAGLQRLCNVQVAGLEAALAARSSAGNRGGGCSGGNCCGPAAGKANPVPWLDCLATLFKEFHPYSPDSPDQHPGLPVMREVWPSLERTLAAFPNCMRVVEHTCRVIRYQVRCLRRSCAPLLPQLADRIMLSYAACPHSCFLYLAGILTDEFGEDPVCQVGLLQLLEAMMGPTLATLESGRGLAQNPDMAEDLFRLCTRFLQRCPGQLLASRALPTIWQLALGSLAAEHRDAVASVTKFLQELLQLGQHDQHREPVLALLSDAEQGGATLTRVLVHASVLQLSSYSLPDAAEVLQSLLLLDQRTVADWIGAALHQLPATRPDGLVQATPEQIQHFHQTLASCGNVSDLSRQLQQLARLFK